MSEKDEVSTGSTSRDEADWKRRRRLAEVFGDERKPEERSTDGDSASDRWLKSQVPPHHG